MTTFKPTPQWGKLGRLSARLPVMLSPIHRLVTLPPAPRSWAGPDDKSFSYGMLGNDVLGDCVFAGFVHLVQSICLLLGVTPPEPTDREVTQAYLLYGHGLDQGAIEADVLHALYVTGILDIDLAGYALGNQGIDELWQITSTFGAGYLGIMVPAPAQGQFQSREPWDLTGTSADRQIEGGHCVVSIAYDQDAELATVLTWGQRQQVTFRWLHAYLDEQWAVIPRQVKDAGGLGGFNWEQLHDDLASVGPTSFH